ncbi:hypothetical protein [Macrococcoides caseolyticum]|uniref:hypothetical protein n=1 Tax=Macrococcoides caseolyticum TaxID=69966 RepID=UPI001E60F20E|nr:hypothetical protein [Macrococcus caseolyticus]
MIKVGDKLHHQEKEWNVEFTGETFVHLKHGDDFIIESSHIFWNKLYAEQKQRADELEKSLNLSILASSNDTLVEELQKALSESNKRADELEKRWSELVDVLKKKYEYYKVRADDESAGPIEQGKWKIAKHELMMVLKIMTDLKRGETE